MINSREFNCGCLFWLAMFFLVAVGIGYLLGKVF